MEEQEHQRKSTQRNRSTASRLPQEPAPDPSKELKQAICKGQSVPRRQSNYTAETPLHVPALRAMALIEELRRQLVGDAPENTSYLGVFYEKTTFHDRIILREARVRPCGRLLHVALQRLTLTLPSDLGIRYSLSFISSKSTE
ncbi:hypothetical protein FVEG_04498 [Fusarium verticillioides 7600]|uniref:Uncharacterized protein n=1 Tax=Gibberella moniliformis (strain M3125 / FGSC 7600) TaxID=334819 RepID=W7M5I7_GIBM7|nr:hypothetical protein FVEG_04498 [Fusarium verticillioides 7600]EWG42759.1 hypothetical protein FVEG_04498 [Fusarium verticillioides 7600]RBQ81634.1 hypothetical protein FVER14953_04498 [Fusarium verticillioides]